MGKEIDFTDELTPQQLKRDFLLTQGIRGLVVPEELKDLYIDYLEFRLTTTMQKMWKLVEPFQKMTPPDLSKPDDK